MKSVGIVLAIIGVLAIVAAAVNHFAAHFLGSISHGTIIVGAVGVVLLIVGVAMSMMGGSAKAA